MQFAKQILYRLATLLAQIILSFSAFEGTLIKPMQTMRTVSVLQLLSPMLMVIRFSYLKHSLLGLSSKTLILIHHNTLGSCSRLSVPPRLLNCHAALTKTIFGVRLDTNQPLRLFDSVIAKCQARHRNLRHHFLQLRRLQRLHRQTVLKDSIKNDSIQKSLQISRKSLNAGVASYLVIGLQSRTQMKPFLQL